MLNSERNVSRNAQAGEKRRGSGGQELGSVICAFFAEGTLRALRVTLCVTSRGLSLRVTLPLGGVTSVTPWEPVTTGDSCDYPGSRLSRRELIGRSGPREQKLVRRMNRRPLHAANPGPHRPASAAAALPASAEAPPATLAQPNNARCRTLQGRHALGRLAAAEGAIGDECESDCMSFPGPRPGARRRTAYYL